MMMKNILYGWLGCLLLFSCAIENDIPYPQVVGEISEIAVEGQRSAHSNSQVASDVVIDRNNRAVTVYVNDSVDVSQLKITRLILNPRDAVLELDSARCDNPDKFPFSDFASLDSLPVSANTRVDFSKPLALVVKTYQDYPWKITVNQVIERSVEADGMVDYALDPDSRNVIIYVAEGQDLSNVQLTKLNLEGTYGQVKPDPATVRDFTSPQTFYAARHGQELWKEWKVFVYHTSGGSTSSSDIFPMVTRATLKGSVQTGKIPAIEYKESKGSDWNTVPASDVTTSGSAFTAVIKGLQASTTYTYRVNIDGQTGAESSFTTAQAIALTNGGFEDWHQDGKQWNPWPSGGSSFWGTGNPGAAAFIDNLTTPTTESVSGKAALLETKNALIKLGAGNIFTGDFELDGTNGILHFGRSFTSFPTSLRLSYKYTSTIINRIGDEVGELEKLRGRPDSCHIYIALSDKPEPYEIRTRPSTRQLFDKNDRNIIAYGEFISGQSISSYQQIDIPLEYRATNRTPKYIIVVLTASKYGDYFIGGEGSTLWADELELVYD